MAMVEEWVPTSEIPDEVGNNKSNCKGRKVKAAAKREPRKPQNGGVMMTVEMSRSLLNELHEIGEADGVNSVYQMIRNACYAYVQSRRGETAQ